LRALRKVIGLRASMHAAFQAHALDLPVPVDLQAGMLWKRQSMIPASTSTTRPWWRWLALSAVVIVLDHITKALIQQSFMPGETHVIAPFFNLVLAFNTGAAFSFLAGAGGWQRQFFIVLTIVVSVFLVWLMRRHPQDRLLCLALSLIFGGAMGNLYDRVMLGHVVDFIQLHARDYYWPAFNVADSAISAGAALLILDALRKPADKPANHSSEA
jgi:signal peptidase II